MMYLRETTIETTKVASAMKKGIITFCQIKKTTTKCDAII